MANEFLTHQTVLTKPPWAPLTITSWPQSVIAPNTVLAVAVAGSWSAGASPSSSEAVGRVLAATWAVAACDGATAGPVLGV